MTHMTNDQVLHLLADDASEPSPNYAERLLRRGRRSLIVRRTATLAGIAAAAAAIFAAPLSLGGPDTWNGPTHARVAASSQATTREALLYEATVRRVLADIHRPQAEIAILDRLCLQPVDPAPPFGCDSEPWADDVRSELADRLSDLGAIRWIDDRAELPAFGDPSATSDVVLFTFGPADIGGDHAELGWSIATLPMGGQGETDSWTWQPDQWSFDGPNGGQMWIS